MNPADSQRRQRRIILLLSAILIPTAVLIVLAFRVAHQETELSERRSAEERREALDQLRRELSARLQAIKLQEVNRRIEESTPRIPTDSPIVFVAPLEQGRLVLPWDGVPISPSPAAEFKRHQAEGEAMEFRNNDAAGAAAAYMRALFTARTTIQKCAAQLSLGRTRFQANLPEEATRLYHAMLDECDAVSDSDGVPFALYAAERLLTAGVETSSARAYVMRRTKMAQWPPPNEAYLLRSLLKMDAENETSRKLSRKIHDIEQMIALSHDIHDRLGELQLAFRSAPGDLSWMGYGDEPWMITVVSATSFAAPVLIAVSSTRVVPAGIKLHANHAAAGTPLGDGFVDLQVEWPADRFPAPRGLPTRLYGAALFLILSATLLAAYLLLRDVHREVEVAQIRSHFVASVSHELKTPLTAIRMFAETMMLGRAVGEQATSEYLRTIVNESERLSRLVDNVLDSSRIEQGRKIYQMQSTCLTDVVRSAARAMEYPLSQLGFTLAITIDNTTPALQADPDALEQAILNLIDNAMKYSGEARRIEMRLGSGNNEAFIDVVDHGIGISPEDQVRIFERFHRVRSTEVDGIAGTGLGLALALHIVHAHRGRIDVSSEPGLGSTFSVRIPLQEPA